eukprot:GFUD01009806.1.p1 GENE.GFUD01009806.1~~GFUD01009806.1.p1  ORF type:complete len:288 (-),score=74.70 GFUD01009806.1:67-930(-)
MDVGSESVEPVCNGNTPEAEPSKPNGTIKTEPNLGTDPTDPDPVVHEIPVYLSRGVNCYLFQYPVRPATMPYDNTDVVRARFRPTNQQVELEMRLNTANANYDRSKGEQIALNTDGVHPAPTPDRTFQSSVMDKQLLTGTAAVTDSGRYAVGILDNNELHLTEVKGLLHLRPSLGYLDKSDRTAKAEGRVATDPDDPADNEVKPEAITVKFARGDPERNKKYKEKSYDFQMKRVEEEPWVEAKFHQMKTYNWEEVSQRMFCGSMDTDVKSLDETPERYLYSLKDAEG